MSTILIIDSDPREHSILSQLLSDFSIESAYSAAEARTMLRQLTPDLILMEISLREESGLSLLAEMHENPPVIVLSACSDTATIVKCMKNGAYNFIAKPYSMDRLMSTVMECITSQCVYQYIDPSTPDGPEGRIIGSSRIIRHLRKKIALYAETDLPVLISGESGSGKELVARTLHLLSKRSDENYRVVHCGAIPLSLFEAELYGSETGAFTGAVTRAGYFEQANRGTIFLDEIGEMPLEGQVKLLRILEDSEIIRVGGHRKISINVRAVAATNRRLAQQTREGKFRSDLLFRINTLQIEVPPLRAHIEDIPLLSRSILEPYTHEVDPLSRDALKKLMRYSWPGNVRELRNVLNRAAVLAGGKLIKSYHIHLNEQDNQTTAAIS